MRQRAQINLQRWREKHLYRQRFSRETPSSAEIIVENQSYLSFSNNDYLGLANHSDVVSAFKKGVDRYGVGSGASALLGGYTSAHRALEEELADFFGYPRCLVFSSGFMANLSVITSLIKKEDTIFIDKLAHASLIDAVLATKATFFRYKHNHVKELKIENRNSNFIITEGVFSMQGDIAPIDELISVSQQHRALLMVDDAHGIGVMGEKGKGVTENKIGVPILMGTFGKAFGTSGAFVASTEELIESLIQFGRSYVYTTALPPALCEATRQSLKIIKNDNARRDYLINLILYFRKNASELGLSLLDSSTPIQPVLIGNNAKTMNYFEKLKLKGIWVAAVRPPTVPPNQSLLRISLNANHTTAHIDSLLSALSQLQ